MTTMVVVRCNIKRMLVNSSQNKKLLGIDIFRGIAAYGVVLIHGLGDMSRDENSLIVTNFFLAFCVPFFLATSLYLSRKSLLSQDRKTYIINRTKRIIIPYFAWSLIYFLARLLGSLIGNKDSFNKLIADPINLIFFGSSSLQLYFLPMLFCGVLAAIPITTFLAKIKNNLLVILCFFLSIWLFDLIVETGNDFVLGEGLAFQNLIDISVLTNFGIFQLIRVILVILAWIIRCTPYIIFSFIINDFPIFQKMHDYFSNSHKIFHNQLILLFLLPIFFGIFMLSNLEIAYFLLPYITLIYAILVSGLISTNAILSLIAKKLGYFSFGIYLFHALITAGFLPIIVKIYPQFGNIQLSPLMLILSSGIIFFVSLTVTYFISLNKTAARILLAA
ncbi:acyltransferase [Nodularia harveyana UHCC-0300]|uniref:Acyltransferase n=1 Tax=Nodularia harveyana UHCC-0300 TaxID=2974287 RepID=A0ABU5UDQ9_9CYAN|nr:acyltransferase [Nodularia harveyana]MEA5581250.1 acyltransferase [Nodularia harveyana UHCC-0300]